MSETCAVCNREHSAYMSCRTHESLGWSDDDMKDALLFAWGALKARTEDVPGLADAMLTALDLADRRGYQVPAFLREM